MPSKEKRLKDAKAAAEEADFRVFQTHNGGWHDTEGFASLHPRLRATRFARAVDLSGRAAVIGCEGIQPERLNAEGDSPSALSRGLSVSATPGAVSPLEKRLKDANVAAKEADFRVFQTHHGRCYDTEGFASLHPRLRATRSARAFDLSGRAAVKLVIVSLSKAVHPD